LRFSLLWRFLLQIRDVGSATRNVRKSPAIFVAVLVVHIAISRGDLNTANRADNSMRKTAWLGFTDKISCGTSRQSKETSAAGDAFVSPAWTLALRSFREKQTRTNQAQHHKKYFIKGSSKI